MDIKNCHLRTAWNLYCMIPQGAILSLMLYKCIAIGRSLVTKLSMALICHTCRTVSPSILYHDNFIHMSRAFYRCQQKASTIAPVHMHSLPDEIRKDRILMDFCKLHKAELFNRLFAQEIGLHCTNMIQKQVWGKGLGTGYSICDLGCKQVTFASHVMLILLVVAGGGASYRTVAAAYFHQTRTLFCTGSCCNATFFFKSYKTKALLALVHFLKTLVRHQKRDWKVSWHAQSPHSGFPVYFIFGLLIAQVSFM